MKNLPARKQPRDEYEEGKKREGGSAESNWSAYKRKRKRQKEKTREREGEREMFEISSRKMIAYLRGRYRAVMSDFA